MTAKSRQQNQPATSLLSNETNLQPQKSTQYALTGCTQGENVVVLQALKVFLLLSHPSTRRRLCRASCWWLHHHPSAGIWSRSPQHLSIVLGALMKLQGFCSHSCPCSSQKLLCFNPDQVKFFVPGGSNPAAQGAGREPSLV